jgi:hypothetical protein
MHGYFQNLRVQGSRELTISQIIFHEKHRSSRPPAVIILVICILVICANCRVWQTRCGLCARCGEDQLQRANISSSQIAFNDRVNRPASFDPILVFIASRKLEFFVPFDHVQTMIESMSADRRHPVTLPSHCAPSL